MSEPMTPGQALVHLRQYQERPAPTWSTASYGRSSAESTLAEIGRTLAAEVTCLRAELATVRALAADATEYRVPVPENGGAELLVRRSAPGFGDGWAVSLMARGGGRAWTGEGWQEVISALSVDRLFCWPDAVTAIAEGRRALTSEAGEGRG